MSSNQGKTATTFLHSYWLVLIAPLLAFPFMLNLRVFPFVAPNEEPKWAMLTLCALWMGLALAWLWFKQKETLKIGTLGFTGVLLIMYLLLLGVGVFIGPNQTEGMIRFAFWFFCIVIIVSSAWAVRFKPKWFDALIWSLSVGSFIFSLRYWWSYVLDFGKPNYNIHVLFSPIGHVNFTGDVLIILLPTLIWILATKHNPILRVLNWFSISTIATILLLASSRGALGGVALAVITLLVLGIKHYPQWQQLSHKKVYAIPTLLVLSSLFSSYFIYDALPYHYRDLTRVSSTAGQAVTGKGKIALTPNVEQPPMVNMWVKFSPVLGARTSIFASTTAMTLDSPWLGQGTGNFAWIYPSFSNRYPDFRDALSSARTFTTNPHNVVLQIGSQNGIIAITIFMLLLLYFWYRLAASTWQHWNGWHAAGTAAITAVIFDAMFNHVFFNPASMFVFALLSGAWWGTLSISNKKTFNIQPRIASILSLSIIIALCIWPTRWIISEWYVGHAMVYAKQASQEQFHYQKAYAWDNENFRAVFGMGQVAYKQKRYAKSVRFFEEFEQFYPYNPPALNMLGAAYMSIGQFAKAEAAFQRALKIYPQFDMVKQNLQRVQIILEQKKLQKSP